MEERKFTEQEVKEAIAKALDDYKKDTDIETLKAELETQLGTLAEDRKAFETEMETFTSTKATFEEAREGLMTVDEYTEKLKTAVAEAVELNEKFHVRVQKFTEAGIKLDDIGMEKLKSMADEECDWFFNTIVENKSEVVEENTSEETEESNEETNEEETSNESEASEENEEENDENNSATAEEVNQTPPVGVNAGGELPSHIEVIKEKLGKKIGSR